MHARILLTALLLACAPSAEPPASDAPSGQPPAAPQDSPGTATDPPASGAQVPADQPWSEAGLDAQPRLEAYRARIPPDLGWTPEATPWRPVGAELRGRLDSIPTTSLSEVMAGVQLALEPSAALGEDVWEVTTRVLHHDDGTATGVVLRWGYQDDAVAGHDVRVHLRSVDGGWTIESADERYQCRRGVSAENLCL